MPCCQNRAIANDQARQYSMEFEIAYALACTSSKMCHRRYLQSEKPRCAIPYRSAPAQARRMDNCGGAITSFRCMYNVFLAPLFLTLSWQAFHDISLEMQSADVPLISSVIPRIDALVHVIDTFKDDKSKHPAVRSAAIRGLTILNKYYQKSDESFVYRIAMGTSHTPLTPRAISLT